MASEVAASSTIAHVPVPRVSPELQAVIAANRAQAQARRQQKRLAFVRSLPVTELPPEADSQPVSKFTNGQIGVTHVNSGSSVRNRFYMGNTIADQARRATAVAAASSGCAILATEGIDQVNHVVS